MPTAPRYFFVCTVFIAAMLGLLSHVIAHPGSDQKLNYINLQIKANPKRQALYLQRTWLWIMDQQFDHALADINLAEQLDPPINTNFHKGLLYSHWGQAKKGIRHLDQFIQQHPSHLAALEARAEAHRSLSNTQAALNDYQLILKQTPYPNPGQYLTAAILAQKANGYRAALNIVDQGIKKTGLNPQLMQYAIKLEVDRKNYKQALYRLNLLEPSMDNNPSWHLQMAELLIKSNDLSNAQKELLKTKKLLAAYKPTAWLDKTTKQLLQLYQQLDCQRAKQQNNCSKKQR